MMHPKRLKAGDVIGLVATSSPVEEERAKQCKGVLEQLGFRVKAADNLYASKGGYMAGEEEVRGRWLNDMFADDEVDAIFCLRGGDGANRILEYLDLDMIEKHPKIFVGYSDVTSLHLLFNQRCGLVTYHGPMVSSNMVDNFDRESKTAFFEALTAEDCYTYKAPEGFPIGVARAGHGEGILVGGNLTVMCASVGTPCEIDTEGKILFIEEIGEHIGNLDRHIYQLRNARKFDGLAGIILGQFTRCNVDVEGYDIVQVVKEATRDLDIPIMYNIQSGHGELMITVPMGGTCIMDTEKGEILFPVEK